MSEIKLDCQDLPCPQPVLKCREIIEKKRPGVLDIVIDNEAAEKNITRYLGSVQYEVVSTRKEGKGTVLRARKKESSESNGSRAATEEAPATHVQCNCSQTLVFITSQTIGSGDDELGSKLMSNFFSTLPEMDTIWRIIFVNSGVKLAVEGSQVLPALKELEERGIRFLVCGTCLDFFGLAEKKVVGETTNMLDVVTSLQMADKVIQI